LPVPADRIPRRQLKYDGIYSAVTFICSKTDDISVTEAAESLGIEEEISESWTRIQELTDEIRNLKSDMADLKDERNACSDLIDKIEQAWDKWEALGSKLANGATVYAPPNTPSKKRKRQSQPKGSRKNRSPSDIDSDFSDSDGSDSSDKENRESPDEDREPLTADQIENKLASLKAEKKEVRAKKKEIEDKVKAGREAIKELVTEKEMLLAEVKAVCIQGRNEYSRRAIKQDFAMGIKE
jgi:predicted  nucleic acid-binding Zn-ribbon protein